MTDLDEKDDELIVFEATEQAIVPYAVTPQACERVLKGFAEGARIG